MKHSAPPEPLAKRRFSSRRVAEDAIDRAKSSDQRSWYELVRSGEECEVYAEFAQPDLAPRDTGERES